MIKASGLNPQCPEGHRDFASGLSGRGSRFKSAVPRRAPRHHLKAKADEAKGFNPQCPEGHRDSDGVPARVAYRFNPQCPEGHRDLLRKEPVCYETFQSAVPRRAPRHVLPGKWGNDYTFQSAVPRRAPRRMSKITEISAGSRFNPQCPEGHRDSISTM